MLGVSITGFFSGDGVEVDVGFGAPHLPANKKKTRSITLNRHNLSIASPAMAAITPQPAQKPRVSGRHDSASQITIASLNCMADRLYLSIWFPSFHTQEMMPRLLSVLKQFPFSTSRGGVGYIGVRSISWDQPIVFEQTFDYRADPERALTLAGEFLHEDNAYEIEALWDLWVPVQEGDLDETWELQSQSVKFVAFGTRFEEATYQQNGHIQVDFGLDTPFLYEEAYFTGALEQRIKSNVQKLVNFTSAVEKNCGISGRVLWSESEDNLAQKLIDRLQRVQ